MVADTDTHMCGYLARTAATTVPLPTPDGPDSTVSGPAGGMAVNVTGLSSPSWRGARSEDHAGAIRATAKVRTGVTSNAGGRSRWPTPTYQAGDLTYVPTPTIGRVTVGPSGNSIVLLAQDAQGAITNVTSIGSSNAVQAIQLAGTPSGNAFTLSFGGHATAPIATTTSPPAIYFLWTFPTVAGHSYDLAVNWWRDDDPSNYQPGEGLYFEVLEGGAAVAGLAVGPSVPAGLFEDAGQVSPAGLPVPWLPVTPGNAPVVASGSSAQVRLSGNGLGIPWMSGLRVRDATAGGPPTYYDLTETANWSTSGAGNWTQGANAAYFGGQLIKAPYGGSGAGSVTAITPTTDGGGNVTASAASLLQAALEALPSIGQGDVLVTDLSGTATGHYQVTFAGSLVNSVQPAITCANPAVSITQVAAGGEGPSLTINGGTPMLLGDHVYTESAPLPYVLLPLPQSAPAVQTCVVNMLPYEQSNYWDRQVASDPDSLSGGPVYGWSAGLTMSFPFPLLPPGTYQFAVTYPHAPFTRNNDPVTYSPSTATQFLVQDDLGNTLASHSVDQTAAPSSYTDSTGRGWHVLGSLTTALRGGLTLVMTTVGQSATSAGGTQFAAILDAVQVTRTSADESVVIGPGDVATLDIPAGWMTTTAGPVPAIAGLSVSPPSPSSILPPFVAGPKSMKIGYNVEPLGYGNNAVTHSNLSYMLPTMGSVQDSDGYPTRFVNLSYSPGQVEYPVLLKNAGLPYGDPSPGSYVINSGRFAMTWAGDGTIDLVAYAGTTITPVSVAKPSNVAGNWVVYDIQCDPLQTASPCFAIRLSSGVRDLVLDPSGNTFFISLSGLQIYPPDPADPTGDTIWGLDAATNTWTQPPKFHPWFLDKLQGVNCLRFLDPLNTNYNPCSLLSHYKPETHANRATPASATASVGVAQIRQATAQEAYYPPTGWVCLHVATTAPHGLFDGCRVQFSGCGTAQFAQGGTGLLLDGPSVYGLVHPIDATNLTLDLPYYYITSAMTNVLAGGSLVATEFGTNWPLQDVVDLVKAVPTVTDLHFNAAITLDTTPGGQGVDAVAAFLAANLPAGLKVHVEPGNECWNPDFSTHIWCTLKNSAITGKFDGSYEVFFAGQGQAIHNRFFAMFQAAGRGGDVVRLYGTWAGRPDITAQILAQTKANGAAVDEVCVALYFGGQPFAGYDSDQLPIFNRMTTGQLLDYAELNTEYGGWPENLISNQYPVLQQYGYGGTKVIGYEGSVGGLVPVDPVGSLPPGNTPNFALRQNAAKRHPRMYGVLLRMAQKFQDAGLAMWSYFNLGAGTGYTCWSCYETGNQQRGTGDPVADAINIVSPQAKNQALNEVAGGIYRWATLVAPTKTTTTNKIVPGRNGRIGAIGFPRGMFRPTRAR